MLSLDVNASFFCPGDCPFKSKPSPTSAHACAEVTGCSPTTKRLACVAPEVDLGECTLHLPPQKAKKVEPTLALKPRREVTKNSNVSKPISGPQKGHVSAQNYFKKVGMPYLPCPSKTQSSSNPPSVSNVITSINKL